MFVRTILFFNIEDKKPKKGIESMANIGETAKSDPRHIIEKHYHYFLIRDSYNSSIINKFNSFMHQRKLIYGK